MPAVQASLAIICDSMPPYRIHFHRRIVHELPWLKLWTINTHEGDDGRWQQADPPDIHPINLASPQHHRHGFSWASWKTGGRIIRWLAAQRVSAVVVLGYNDPGRLRVFRWCRRRGVPCFVWGDSNVRGDHARGIVRLAKKTLLNWVVRNTRGAMCCGRMGRAFFERYGAEPQHIFYLPYEPNYEQIQGITSDSVRATLAEFGLPPERRRIVFSGRLTAQKYPELLLQSFLDIAARRPEWDLLFIGDGELRCDLSAMLPDRLRERVYWTGFLSDQTKISALYRGSDLLALPSRYEPWALVVNEAAAAGMAIVSTDVVGAAAELVRNGVNGFVVPPEDGPALTEALLAATDPLRIDAMKRASLPILAEWRRVADPVGNLVAALERVGVRAP